MKVGVENREHHRATDAHAIACIFVNVNAVAARVAGSAVTLPGQKGKKDQATLKRLTPCCSNNEPMNLSVCRDGGLEGKGVCVICVARQTVNMKWRRCLSSQTLKGSWDWKICEPCGEQHRILNGGTKGGIRKIEKAGRKKEADDDDHRFLIRSPQNVRHKKFEGSQVRCSSGRCRRSLFNR